MAPGTVQSNDGPVEGTMSSQPSKSRRVMTEKRREQNRQAQRIHREKQKRRLQELANLEAQSKISEATSLSGETQQNVSEPSHDETVGTNNAQQNGSDPEPIVADPQILDRSTQSGLEAADLNASHADFGFGMGGPDFGAEVMANSWNIPSLEPKGMAPWPEEEIAEVGLSSVSRQDQCILDSVDIPWPEQNSENPPYIETAIAAGENINQLIARKGISMEDIILAGLEAITQKYSRALPHSNSNLQQIYQNASPIFSSRWAKSNASTSFTPSPSSTHIPLRTIALHAACVANAANIGVDIYKELCRPQSHNEYTPSPFYQPELANMALNPATIATLYQSIKPDLRPSVAQLKQPHHMYIDTFPFPAFRQRILALKSCVVEGEAGEGAEEEKIFDETEFTRDIDSEGIVCWGSDAEIGTGAPWDRRSWECRPWFLKKWWMVTGGVDGELGKQSRWWAEMRGEAFEEI